MPLPPPPHEQRERWMTAISASFTNATTWRYVRYMLVETNTLRTDLGLGIHKLTRTLDDFWLGPRVIVIWKCIAHRVNKLFYGWQSILDWLEERKWRKPEFRLEKEQVIKTLVVLNYYTSTILRLYKDSFETVFECFRRHRRVTSSKKRPRRWSTGNQHLYSTRIFENRHYYERILHLYAQLMETTTRNSESDISRLYNNSNLFENFVADVQQNNKAQADYWEAWGKKYPWPSCQLKNLGNKDSDLWRDNEPLDGVLSWEEDEDLRAMFC